jgi:hypothetical protein
MNIYVHGNSSQTMLSCYNNDMPALNSNICTTRDYWKFINQNINSIFPSSHTAGINYVPFTYYFESLTNGNTPVKFFHEFFLLHILHNAIQLTPNVHNLRCIYVFFNVKILRKITVYDKN